VTSLTYPYVIADVGSNWAVSGKHEDALFLAKRHIYDGALAGVSAVKFQLFTDRELYGMDGPDRYALPPSWLPELAAYATEKGVDFMCTAFSPKGYETVDPFVNTHKVASAEMKDREILEKVASLGKFALISTGGATGMECTSVAEFLEAGGFDNFKFLECIAQYPASPEAYNLSILPRFDFIGVSDHTVSEVIALAGVGLGAKVFEKHFNAVPGTNSPDAAVSIGPAAMESYVRNIKRAYAAVADREKVPHPSEKQMTMQWRRRLKVTAPIKEGEKLEYGKNFGSYRSIYADAEAGPPEAYKFFEGRAAKRDLSPGDPVWKTTVDCWIGQTPEDEG
jgi:sialic acid synthase SpsE